MPHSVRDETMAGGEDEQLCRCERLENQPVCDGSRKRANTEDRRKLYGYDERRRVPQVCPDGFPGISTRWAAAFRWRSAKSGCGARGHS